MYTASTAFLDALHETGISYIFANFGSDHPAILEAIAEARASGRAVPQVITCPDEMVAICAAQGFAMASGRAQAVLVHVDLGTLQLGGVLHNVLRGRTPVLIFAGASPITQEGETRGSRNEFIQWLQDISDQRGIVRDYVRYSNEIRTGKNIKQLIYRAMQIAHSDPKGAVYLMAAREIMEEEVTPVTLNATEWGSVAPCALAPAGLAPLLEELLAAERPLIVTSSLGRNPGAVPELVRLAERLAIGVLESVPMCVNFPADHPMYQGSQWSEPQQNTVLAEADLVLVIDSDVPWIPLINRPAKNAKIFYLDVDPLKETIPLWYIPAKRCFRTDAATALRQINDALNSVKINSDLIHARRQYYTRLSEGRIKRLQEREQPKAGVITPEYLTGCVRRHVGPDTVIVTEGVSNYGVMADHLRPTCPGTLFASGGSSLGWSGGGAIGVKLANPNKTVVCLCGDGSYMFSVPSSVHWMARRYQTPFVQVIYNNGGWKSPKLSALAVHPQGSASKAKDLNISFDPPADYAGIAAAAGGAWGKTVRQPEELTAALEEAFQVVREERRCAVLDVWLPHL